MLNGFFTNALEIQKWEFFRKSKKCMISPQMMEMDIVAVINANRTIGLASPRFCHTPLYVNH
jgi:hypothetical protein